MNIIFLISIHRFKDVFFIPIIESASCRCHGGSHCHTFDGAVIHHYGACTYTLVRDGCVNGRATGMWK